LASTTLVSKTSRNECGTSSSIASNTKFTDKSKTRGASTNTKQILKTGDLDSFRKKLSSEGILDKAASLITGSRRKGTNANYESAWRKWSDWCCRKEIDPFGCNLKFILDFLAELFDLGFSYSSIGTHRSAISAYHDLIDGLAIGKHSRVCALMTSIFNKRPPTPKYTFIWDVEIVLTLPGLGGV